jgi:hypothetical protein
MLFLGNVTPRNSRMAEPIRSQSQTGPRRDYIVLGGDCELDRNNAHCDRRRFRGNPCTSYEQHATCMYFPPSLFVCGMRSSIFCQALSETQFDYRMNAGLQSNLYQVQMDSKTLLPEFNLKRGEVTRIGQFPVSGSASMDIWEVSAP